SLDVRLCFEVPSIAYPIPTGTTWTAVASELYSPQRVTKPPREESVDVSLEWLRGCIRTIRMISSSICECATEYPTAVALYLLRRACYPPRGEDNLRREADGYRRAYAYWLGAQLVEDLVSRAAPIAL